MRTVLLSLMVGVLAAPAYSQSAVTGSSAAMPRTKASARPTATAPAPNRFKPEIPVSAPIFTLGGVCQNEQKGTAKAPAECKTVVTRGQLEALVAAIDPEASPKVQQQFAVSYARLLAATSLAEKKRLDKDPKITHEIQMQQSLVRMQVLTDYVLRGLQMQAQHTPDAEIEEYYKANAPRYESAMVQRVAIPLTATTESGKTVDAAAAKAEMEELRRAVDKGDDFEFLQSKAYKDLDLKGPLPSTTVSLARYQALSADEAKVFDMSSGETSQVFEGQGGYVMLRLVDKHQMPLHEVRTQIETTLALRHELDAIHAAFQGIDADFNLKFLDSKSQPELFPLSLMTQGQLRRGLQSSSKIQP